MGDTFLGLREKRFKPNLVHIDAVLTIYGLEPAEIPNKGRMPVRSAYFRRNDRCRDMLRDKGSARADDIAVQAMRDKVMDSEADRKTRADFIRRILVSLQSELADQ